MPGVGPPGASGKKFRVSRCYLWVKRQGAVHRAPLSLASLPGWTPSPGDTCICVCSPEAHMRLPLLEPGHYLPLAGSQSLLHSALSGVHSSARELSQCPVLALVRQALIGDPSLLSFNVLIPAFGWERVSISCGSSSRSPSVHKLLFLTLCTLFLPVTAFPTWLHWEEACARRSPVEGATPSDLRDPWRWGRGLGTF